MKKLNLIEKIGLIIITIGLVWMVGKTIYGLGYRNGVIDATQETSDELLVACEEKIDELTDACDAKAEQARIDGRNEILEQF